MSDATQITPLSVGPQDYQSDYQTIVRSTGVFSNDGRSLLKAYALAKKNYKKLGGILSGKRYAIILEPGIYDLGMESLILDTAGIDILGISVSARSSIVNTVGSNFSVIKNNSELLRSCVNQGAIIQKAPNIYLANLRIKSELSPNIDIDRYGGTFVHSNTYDFYKILGEINSLSVNSRVLLGPFQFTTNPEVSNLLLEGLPQGVVGQPGYSKIRHFAIRKIDYNSSTTDTIGGILRFFIPFRTHTDAAGSYRLAHSLGDTGEYILLNTTSFDSTNTSTKLAAHFTVTNTPSTSFEANGKSLAESWEWWNPMANQNSSEGGSSANKYFFFQIPYSEIFNLTPEEIANSSLREIKRTISFYVRFDASPGAGAPSASTLPITIEVTARLTSFPFNPSTTTSGSRYWPRSATTVSSGTVINYNYPSYRKQPLGHASAYFPDIFTSTTDSQFLWNRKARLDPINPRIKSFNCSFQESKPLITYGINSMRTNYNYTDCSFENCSAGRSGFGGGDNNVFGGINLDISFSEANDYYSEFINCTGGAISFGGDMGGLSNLNSTSENKIIAARFINCRGGSYSFGANGAIRNSYFENCEATLHSFAGEIVNSVFLNSKAWDYSFGTDLSRRNGLISKSKFENCSAKDYSFGYGAKSIDSTFEKCTAGVHSFGDMIENGNYSFCEAKQNSFGGEGVGRPFIQNKLYLWGATTKSGSGLSTFYLNEEEYAVKRQLSSSILGVHDNTSTFPENHALGDIDTFMLGSIHHASFGNLLNRNKTYLFELLIYDKKLNFNEIERVEGYLNNKYSLGFADSKFGILLEDNLALRIDSSLDSNEIQTVNGVDYIAKISDLSNHERNFIKNPKSFAGGESFSSVANLPYLLSLPTATQLKLNIGFKRPIVLDNIRHLINERPEDFRQILRNEYTIFAVVAFEPDGGSLFEKDILYGLNFDILLNEQGNGGRNPFYHNTLSRYFRFGYSTQRGLFLTNNNRDPYVFEYSVDFLKQSIKTLYRQRAYPANCIGKFFKCSALDGSFGGFWAENDSSKLFLQEPNFNFNITGIVSGTFEHCSAGNHSFNGVNYGKFIDVSANNYSFNKKSLNNNAMYLGCLGGNRSL
jgi:hypothetical protein